MGKFCRQCGAPVEPGNRFCDECGAPIEAAPPVPSPPPPQPVPQASIPQAPIPPVPQPTPGARSVPVPLIIGAVIVVIAIIAAIVLLPGLFPHQDGSKGVIKGTPSSMVKTTGTAAKYVVGDIVKESDGTLYMVLGIHKASGRYAYGILHKQSDGTYYAYDTLWLNWMDKPFEEFEAKYSKVDYQDPNKVVVESLLGPSTHTPKYAVGDIVMSTSDLTSGYLSIVLDLDRANGRYTSNLVYKEKDGTYLTGYDEWRRPYYQSFSVFDEIFTKKIDHVDPGKVRTVYKSTELPVTQ